MMTPTNSDEPPPKPIQQTRQRAPTISIDDTATNPPSQEATSPSGDRPAALPRIQTEGLDSQRRPPSPYTASPTDTRPNDNLGSRPTSPHNVSAPRNQLLDGAAFLSVPVKRDRASSDSDGGHSPISYGGDTHIPSTISNEDSLRKTSFSNNEEIIHDKDALKADPGLEPDFEVENNKFAFFAGAIEQADKSEKSLRFPRTRWSCRTREGTTNRSKNGFKCR